MKTTIHYSDGRSEIRDMTTDELAAYKQMQTDTKQQNKANADALAAKIAARQAVLDKLGLTADEAAALFG